MPRVSNVAAIAADADLMTETPVYFETPEWIALMDWLEWHGIDPRNIPAGTRVSRDACGRCIRYVAILQDQDGKRRHHGPPSFALVTAPAVEQGEAPPLPFPDVILRHLHPAQETA